jgi:DNA ligase D-like protein (predicted 3'-phosphoesterase)
VAAGDALTEYRRKRDFGRTAEPKGRARRGRSGGSPRFVVQKHDASRLHYDFRLDVDGVMKSWAVPKGPSTDPGEKRLAVPTEDHPLDYQDFEGVIPAGQYGAGTVLVWDAGTYRNLNEREDREVPMGEALAAGHAKFWLEGEKLRGGWALTRFRSGKDEAWLLVKMDDEWADPRQEPVRSRPESVLTGRTLEEIAAAGKT